MATLVVLIGVALSPPARSHKPTELHGRTWVSVPTAGGADLVLINGISGLIEGRVLDGAGTWPEGLQVVATSDNRTLLGSSDALVLVDDGSHQAVAQRGVDGRLATFAGPEILVVNEQAELWSTALEQARAQLDLDADPIQSQAALRDHEGRVWLLAQPRGGGSSEATVAVHYDPTSGEVGYHQATDTEALLLVDGVVHLVGPDRSVTSTADGTAKPLVAGATALPSLVVDGHNRWAAGNGSELVVLGPSTEETIQLDAPVTELAIWHGAVVAITPEGTTLVRPDGSTRPVPLLDQEARVHTAGGLLWLTAGTDVVAMWPDHTVVPFELVGVDADLCVDGCDEGDLSRYLDDPPPTTQPPNQVTTTTQPPRDLTPPKVEPLQATTTTAPPATVPPTTTPPTTTPPPTTVVPELTIPETESVIPTVPPAATATTGLRPSSTTSSTAPPLDPNTLTLEVTPPVEGDPIMVTVAVGGDRAACVGTGPNEVDATVSWSGSAAGSRQVRLLWNPGSGTRSATFAIADFSNGPVRVQMDACGLRATRDIIIELSIPTVGQIWFTPETPTPGVQVTARVDWAMPPGFTVTSTWWSGGPCGMATQHMDSTPRRSEVFEAFGDRLCVSVVLVVAHADEIEMIERQGDVATNIAPPGGGDTTTTTDDDSTTTTDDDGGTTTTTTDDDDDDDDGGDGPTTTIDGDDGDGDDEDGGGTSSTEPGGPPRFPWWPPSPDSP